MNMCDFCVYPDGITLDCKALQEIEPTAKELEALSTEAVNVRAVPNEIGGYIPSEIFIWIGENLVLPLTVSFLYDLLKKHIPPIIQLFRSRLANQKNSSNINSDDGDVKFFLAFKGKSTHFAIDISSDMDQESLEKALDLFAQMVDVIKSKES